MYNPITDDKFENVGKQFDKDIDYLTDSIICDCRDFANKYDYEFDFVVKAACEAIHKKCKKYYEGVDNDD